METNKKYIDISQFPRNKNGSVSWMNSVGVIANFSLNNDWHQIEILDYIDSRHIKIKIDDAFVKIVQSGEIINLSFEKLFYKPTYRYGIGDVINNVEILEKTKTKHSKSDKYFQKAYKCRCLKDDNMFIVSECDLNRGHGCPLCANKVVVRGINDIATTNPEMVKYLNHKENAYKYTAQSNKKIEAKCPICGFIKSMSICSLCNNGFSCDICSDGISYPNKFAHELFRQLSNQYLKYEYEYTSDWSKNYFYDNYIKLLNNEEIIVEMDGAYHYIDRWKNNHDEEKDFLAKSHNINVIRIDCNYKKVSERFEYIKNNIVLSLKNYFDLDFIDWNKCDLCGVSSIVVEVAKYYNDNPKAMNVDIAKHFNISIYTLREYLHVGERLGLCNYVRNNPDRLRISKPIAIYDKNNNIVGIYSSAKQLEKNLSELKLYKSSVFRAAQNNKQYKGYLFKFVTYEEYQSFNNINN